MTARIPKPPLTNDNKALHKHLTDLTNFLQEIYSNGLKHQGFTQAQIDNFTDLSFLGTLVYNEDTGESNISVKNMAGDGVEWLPVGRTS